MIEIRTSNCYFKYRSLENPKRVLDILINKRLYGAKYLALNDPMEGQFDFDLSGKFDHPVLQEMFDERAKTLICSLSKKKNDDDIPNNGILWSMYADEHRGCCIEVEVENTEWKKEEVYYTSRKPIVNERVSVTDILGIKNIQWKYEDEVRFINTNPESPYLKVKIKAVYLGVRMSAEDVALYTSLINAVDKDIKVRQLKRKELDWTRN